MRKAFITGILGQDGSYLAELLLEKGYNVFGMVAPRSISDTSNISQFKNKDHFELVSGDMTDGIALQNLMHEIEPDEIYNLAAQSFVQTSWSNPIYTTEVNFLGTLHLLEAMRKECFDAKFYQASSSEMYGNSYPNFHPVSPYGVSKLAAHETVRNYRETYNLFACSGICFNHESPRRGKHFVTQKIVQAAVKMKVGLQKNLILGNLDSYRDFGHAKDYVRAMWMMLQAPEPFDYEIATGETHQIREVLEYVFNKLDLDLERIQFSSKLARPLELHKLQGNPSVIKIELGWYSEYDFKQLFDEMIQYAQKEL